MSDLPVIQSGSGESTELETSILDRANPRAVINLVPPAVQRAIENVPQDFFSLTEVELEKESPQGKWTIADRRMRTSFWLEYTRSQDTGHAMSMSLVYGGICSRNYFYESFLTNKARMAYLLSQPADYKIAVEEALTCSVDKVREILEMPLYDPVTGRPDTKVAEAILKAFKMLDDRVKGAVVQRVEQKNLNVNYEAGKKPGATPETMDDLDKKLADMRARAGQSLNALPAEFTVQETEQDGD